MPLTFWFTGIPQSGKSTLSRLTRDLLAARGNPVQVLDGDEIRAATGFRGFSPDDRRRHALYVAYMARMLNAHGIWAAVALVSPYRKDREACRDLVGSSFVECFVQCPAAICAVRDTKGLYDRADRNQMSGLTGYDAPYENPDRAELVFRTERESPEDCRSRLAAYLKDHVR